jgi:hypothetical protein
MQAKERIDCQLVEVAASVMVSCLLLSLRIEQNHSLLIDRYYQLLDWRLEPAPKSIHV